MKKDEGVDGKVEPQGNIGSDGADLRPNPEEGLRDIEAPGSPDEQHVDEPAIQKVISDFSRAEKRRADDVRAATLARDAIRKEYARLGGAFSPDEATVAWIEYTLSTKEDQERIDAELSSKTPPVASRLLALLRINYPQVRHYAVDLVSCVATDTIFERPTTLEVVAKKSGLMVKELEELADRANLQEAAFFKAFLPEAVHRELQLVAADSVNSLAQEMLLVMDRTMKGLKGRGPFYHGAVMQADIERRR